MGNFIGKDEYDFEALNHLPSNYVKYIEHLIGDSVLDMKQVPNYSDTYLHVQVKTPDGKILYGLQGGPNDSTQHLFYNKNLFMFNMIPLSDMQQKAFTKNLFLDNFANKIDSQLGKHYKINFGDRVIEVRPIFFP
jgi:hypothetical protein